MGINIVQSPIARGIALGLAGGSLALGFTRYTYGGQLDHWMPSIGALAVGATTAATGGACAINAAYNIRHGYGKQYFQGLAGSELAFGMGVGLIGAIGVVDLVDKAIGDAPDVSIRPR